MIHGVHHDHPNDPLRLGDAARGEHPAGDHRGRLDLPGRRLAARPRGRRGFLVGYLIYDEIHYALHHHVPKSRLGKRLRELHMRHHFQDDEKGFGISAPYWDVVFRTYPERRRRARPGDRACCRTREPTWGIRGRGRDRRRPARRGRAARDRARAPADARAAGRGAGRHRVRRRRRHRGGRPAPPRPPLRRRRKSGGVGEIVASNSFLVDVHLIRRG